MPIYLDEQEHTEMDLAVKKLPEDIQRVYITAREAADSPADASKSQEATIPPVEELVRPEPFGLNPPPSWMDQKPEPRPEPKVLYKTKSGVEITDHDVDNAIGVAFGAGPASLTGKFDSYINSFVSAVKSPSVAEKAAAIKALEAEKTSAGIPKTEPIMDDTEKALKAIYDVLDGPGAYEAKYAPKPKKDIFDYIQTEDGKYEIFNATSGKTHAMVDNEAQALSLVKTYHTTGGPKTIPITESAKKIDEGFQGWNKSDLRDMSPAEASDYYWEFLTKHGDQTAAQFEQKYLNANSFKKGNAWEVFSDLVKKKHAENPYAQIPFESDVPKGWTAIEPGVEIRPPSKKEWSMTGQETAEAYNDAMNAGNSKNANKMYAQFLKDAKASQITDFDLHLETLESPKTVAAMEKVKKLWDEESKAISAVPKDTVYDKIISKIEEIQGQALNKYIQEQAQRYHEAAKQGIRPEAVSKGYDTPAYRGLRLHEGMEVQSVNNFDKNGVMFSSDSPLLADMYASYLSKHPGWKVKEGSFDPGAQVAPLYINTKDYHVYDAKGKTWQEANPKATAEARSADKKGVIIQNVWDEPNSTRTLGKPNTVYITFPKGASTVKSRFAKEFNPESKDMLHMIPVIGVGGAAGYVSLQQENTE